MGISHLILIACRVVQQGALFLAAFALESTESGFRNPNSARPVCCVAVRLFHNPHLKDSAIRIPQSEFRKPRLAVTMGDAAGVGPEVIVKAWQDARVHACCRPVVLGHPEILRKAVHLVGAPYKVMVVDQSEWADMEAPPESIACLPVGDDDLLEAPPCSIDARSGHAAYLAVMRAVQGALAGQFDGLVTAPLNKAALHAAGHNYPGHTELLAECCGVSDFAMMLYLPPESEVGGLKSGESRAATQHTAKSSQHGGLGVVHVTLHIALRDVFARLTTDAILAKCHLAHRSMRDGFGIEAPRLGVCALNPHAGEEGLFGDEESRIIAPAVQQARQQGLQITGPEPTDTLMVRARNGEFDAVVAMYHDQGHIALKLLAMHRAVNVTLGLPIIRTSVAHGTAFDRAWQGTAEASGMVAAIAVAAELAIALVCEDE